MQEVRWGIIGCGDVTEVKSGPAFQKAECSRLVAVMRRDRPKAADYARRHGVPRHYGHAEDLLADAEVDAVYVATPPSSHCELALMAARAGKPCLVEKPMAMNHAECVRMVEAFRGARLPLFVAYYRRALPRFLKARDLLRAGRIGGITSVRVSTSGPLANSEEARRWRYDPAVAGGGLFMDLASHAFDLLDFCAGPIRHVEGFAVNTGGAYRAEDVTAACFEFESGAVGTGIWNFHAGHSEDGIVFTGSQGELFCPIFTDGDLVLRRAGGEEVIPFRNPAHVHQPLVESVVRHILGSGSCDSTGESGARTSRILECCLQGYYAGAVRRKE